MITLYLEATDLSELRAKMYAILGDALGGNYVTRAGPRDLPSTYNQERPYEGDQGPPARDPVPEASDKPRRKHRATRPPVATPDPVPEPVGDIGLGGYEEFVPDGTLTEAEADAMNDIAGLGVVPNPLIDNIANEKVKAEVIGRLADLFTAGKVKVLRGLLDQYGDGAKSFPEIDAAKFPAIREALDRGIAA